MDGFAPVPEQIERPTITALSLHGVTVRYGNVAALSDVNAAFPAGAMSAVIGPNGAGKSSLMKAVLGLEPLASGEIRVLGGDLATMRHRVAYVPQRAAVDWDFPASVQDVVQMGLYPELGMLGRLNVTQRQRIAMSLARVDMAGLADRQIGQLSGGQQQRVFLARALVQDADLYLLDEPLAGVDAATEAALIGVLRDLVKAGKTVIAVHHDLSTVPDYFDHVLMIHRSVVAQGPVNSAFNAQTTARTYRGSPPAR